MYGSDEGSPRYDKPAAPVGVRIVVVVLLLCGLALAALPLTVLLTGGSEPGRLTLENASGETLRGVRVVRIVGTQERLVGSAHALPDGGSTDVTFDPEGDLSLRLEFEHEGGLRTVPLVLTEPATGDLATTVRIGEGLAVSVERTTAGGAATPPPVAPEPAEDSSAAPNEAPRETAAAAGPFPLPEGWSEKWEPWFRHVDWIVGPEAGMAAARESGKPMMLFYSATW
jgi:hypothetical protein